jgi:hypothetical protein
MDHEADPTANAHVGKVTIGGGLSYIIVHTVGTNSTAPCVSKGPDRAARVDCSRSNMASGLVRRCFRVAEECARLRKSWDTMR